MREKSNKKMSDDLISRQAAIDVISILPTIQPEQKTSEWVYGEFDIPHCSICGHDVMPYMVSPYCPNCGAKMEEIENE